ncbi:MAG: hypothetical protein AB1585_20895 [Thermodesulfobacteriota bacterium]
MRVKIKRFDHLRQKTGPRRKETAMKDSGFFGGIYGTAFIGAAIYFIQQASSFWNGVLGFIKALFWPAVLMYKLLEYLKM